MAAPMSDRWDLFPSQDACTAAVATINKNMSFPLADGSTLTWAEPRETADGKYAIPEPPAERMTGVTGYTTTTNPTWPATQGIT
jgi:hypothetical protein